jgi:hypothetical protein
MDLTNATITLFMYWSIALLLIFGGIFSLKKGFRLIQSGNGANHERSSITLMKIKISVGSIGALVMVTAFLWGWAAKTCMPSYSKTKDTEIISLYNALKNREQEIAKAKQLIKDTNVAMASLTEKNIATMNKLNESTSAQYLILSELNRTTKAKDMGRINESILRLLNENQILGRLSIDNDNKENPINK